LIFYSDKSKNLEILRKRKRKSKSVDKKNSKEVDSEQYWDYVQGHPNPYGKEFYDYVKAHKDIKFSSDPEIAEKEMMEVNYKMHTDPMNENTKTLLSEKSTGRILLEMFLGFLDNI